MIGHLVAFLAGVVFGAVCFLSIGAVPWFASLLMLLACTVAALIFLARLEHA